MHTSVEFLLRHGLLVPFSLEPDSCVRRTEGVFAKHGVGRVRPLLGGLDAWRERGYPLSSPAGSRP